MPVTADPLIMVQLVGGGMLLHVACSVGLRLSIEPNSALFDDLFASPMLGDLARRPWLLRGKYFLPWARTPEELGEYWFGTRLLFWGARLGAMLLVAAFATFLISVFYYIGHS